MDLFRQAKFIFYVYRLFCRVSRKSVSMFRNDIYIVSLKYWQRFWKTIFNVLCINEKYFCQSYPVYGYKTKIVWLREIFTKPRGGGWTLILGKCNERFGWTRPFDKHFCDLITRRISRTVHRRMFFMVSGPFRIAVLEHSVYSYIRGDYKQHCATAVVWGRFFELNR